MKCIKCQVEHDGTYGSGKFCGKKCAYFKDAAFRDALSRKYTGIKRPNLCGSNNPNYGGKYSHDPIVSKKYHVSVLKRGQSWSEKERKSHSLRMMGGSNWMRGKHHTEETKQKIREKILSDFSSGRRVLNKTMVSKAEKEIACMLSNMGYDVKMGVRIENRLYDIFVPEKNLILEFNGDYWHMNPRKYSPTSYNKASGMTAEKIWGRDEKKINIATNHGYKICCIWEDDYKSSNNKQELVSEVISRYEK